MSTIRCPQCNLVNWESAIECKRCRVVLQAAGAPAFETSAVGGFQTTPNQFIPPATSNTPFPPINYQPPPSHSNYQQPANNYAYSNSYQPGYGYQQQSPNLKSGLAIASMVFGILALVSSIVLVGLLLAPVGLILSIVALVNAGKKPEQYGGKGFAVAGVTTSAVALLVGLVIAAIAVPNIMAARRAANEGSAISTIRTIVKSGSGIPTYPAGSGFFCSNLPDLVKAGKVNPNLADGENNGYRFAIKQIGTDCVVTATPLSTSSGGRSFFYSHTENHLHAASKRGADADQNDPVIE